MEKSTNLILKVYCKKSFLAIHQQYKEMQKNKKQPAIDEDDDIMDE